MPFSLTDEQWRNCCILIEKLGGYGPTRGIRDDIETAITRVFSDPQIEASVTQALKQAAVAARNFSAALEELATLEKQHARMGEDFLAEADSQTAQARGEFAAFIRRYEDGIQQDLEWREPSRERPRRGRPTDTAIVLLCRSILRSAKHERWVIKDKLGRTSPALIDLVTELAYCASHGGLTLVRDRRAVVRAMAQARELHEADVRDAARLYAELDALAAPAPEKGDAEPICLCSIPPKSV